MKKPLVWSIAGIDSSGGAGSHVDIQTCHHLGVAACSIITAITAQNADELTDIEYVSAEHIDAQLNTLIKEKTPDVIKIGMLGSSSANQRIMRFLTSYSGLVILDPVMFASSGSSLFSGNLNHHLTDLTKLFSHVDLLTPNMMEAEKILNCSLTSYQAIEQGAQAILNLGVSQVLIKGGHAHDHLFSQDYWTNGHESFWLTNHRFPQKNYRGTGCMLSSAIAACLAQGYSIKDALVIATMYTHRGIRLSHPIKQNTAMLYHGGWPEEEVDLPSLSPNPLSHLSTPFTPCPIGFYPIVDSAEWVDKLLPLGVKTIQLRIKDKRDTLETEIEKSIILAKKHCATLFINDYWELAIHFGANGIHLGQDDLQHADIEKIHRAGLYLGVSTHCYFEVARAHALKPSYIACGPIYPTTSKIMPFRPQGIAQLQRWRRTLHYPLVAIGGITLEQLPTILDSGVTGVALISAITKANDPLATTKQFLTQIGE